MAVTSSVHAASQYTLTPRALTGPLLPITVLLDTTA
jgi:hypothetical protein